MYRLSLKNAVLSLIIVIFGSALSIIISLAMHLSIVVPVSLLFIGAYVAFLTLSLLLFSKAPIRQAFIIATIGLILFITTILVSSALLFILGVKNYDFALLIYKLNPYMLGFNFLLSIIASKLMFRLEKIKPNQLEKPVINQEKTDISQENPVNQVNAESIVPQNKVEDEVIVEKEPVFIQSEIIRKEEPEQAEIKEKLGELPGLDLECNETDLLDLKETVEQEGQGQFIPENVRLAEKMTNKNNDSEGSISSIGKLLVNQRDIENIIETNALIQHIGGSSSGPKIISSSLGEKYAEKFKQINSQYEQINDIALLDSAGFILSSNIEDKDKEQRLGAIFSGAFQTIENYLAQININSPSRICFETASTNMLMAKIPDKLLFTSAEVPYGFIDYGSFQTIFDKAALSEEEALNIKKNFSLNETFIANSNGVLLAGNPNNTKLASLLTAIFENIKVFISNFQVDKLDKITIFTDNEIIILKKYKENVVGFSLPLNNTVKLNDFAMKVDQLFMQEHQ